MHMHRFSIMMPFGWEGFSVRLTFRFKSYEIFEDKI